MPFHSPVFPSLNDSGFVWAMQTLIKPVCLIFCRVDTCWAKAGTENSIAATADTMT